MQPSNSELHYIHYMGTETEQQNIPIRIRCSQWRVRDTTIWLSSTSAASSTITASRRAEHTNKDQVFAVVNQRHNNMVLHRTSQLQSGSPQDLRYQINCHCARACTHAHTHKTQVSSAYSCHKQMQHLTRARNILNKT